MRFLIVAATALAVLSSGVSALNGWDLTITDSNNKKIQTGGSDKDGTWKCQRLGSLEPASIDFIQYLMVDTLCCAYLHVNEACGHSKKDPPGVCFGLGADKKSEPWLDEIKSVEVECLGGGDNNDKYDRQSKHSTKAEKKCYHANDCSISNGGECEDHCGDRGYSHMTGDDCGWFQKKCCCITK